MDYLKLACEHLGVEESQVLKHRLEKNEIVVILDLGTSGCPKYAIRLETLTPKKKPVEVNATDGARRYAREHGVDLADIARATSGRITVNVVKGYVREVGDD